ncbi:MAG: hypothetical protein KF878_32755 [Planctomycetes bacterium]|nr:hypothetical protein [Planctomycetota bacterium]
MSNLHERAVSQRNMLERIAAKIPGFAGYLERETRRDADKLQRDFCADRLFAQKTPIKRVLDDLITGGDLDGITPFEKLMNRLDRVAQRIKNADRGYSGLFDTIKVDEDDLMRVYEHDLGLTDAVTEVAHKVSEMDAGDRDKLMARVKETIELVDRVDAFFSKREEILRKGA